MRAIYRPGFDICKTGVMLLDLQPDSVLQHELDLDDDDLVDRHRRSLMSALDKLNDRYGKGTVFTASAGVAGDAREWSMRQQRRTPHYTTSWADIPLARA